MSDDYGYSELIASEEGVMDTAADSPGWLSDLFSWGGKTLTGGVTSLASAAGAGLTAPAPLVQRTGAVASVSNPLTATRTAVAPASMSNGTMIALAVAVVCVVLIARS